MDESVTAPSKVHLFDLPYLFIVSVIESLLFEEIVFLVDFILLSNKKGRRMWHAQIKREIRCPDMDYRRYDISIELYNHIYLQIFPASKHPNITTNIEHRTFQHTNLFINTYRYSEDSLRWVLMREIRIRNFTTRHLRTDRSELHYASREGKAWLVAACLEFNDDGINAPDKYCMTPLHLASMKANVELVKLLLESGAEPSLSQKCHSQGIPIDGAIRNNKIDTVKLLLTYHQRDKKMALEILGPAFVLAAGLQKLEIVKLVLGICGAAIIYSRNSFGSTALHESCSGSSGDTEVMELLLESGAEVNASDDAGCTALCYSINCSRPECVKVLLAAGAAVNRLSNSGTSPLEYAQAKVNRSAEVAAVIELLEAAGGLTATAQMEDACA